HDPGITILEQLCYAITDLSYRLDFEMKDLLAPPPGENRKQFFTAGEILTVNPLTINDYRKLLIDIDGVKNAWLEPIQNSEPPIYYDSLRHTLTFQSDDFTQLVNLNGLYRVLIEAEKNVVRKSDESNLSESNESNLSESNESNLSESNESNLSESNESSLSESNESSLSESNESSLLESDESNLSESNESNLSESDESNLSESNESNLSESDESNLSESNESSLSEFDESSLLKKVKSKLNQHRNLCEDFASVEILPPEEITIEAEIEVKEGFNVNELMAQIYFGLDNFISPHLQFFSLKELLDKGKTPEAIFDGFPLGHGFEHGFIDDEQLDNFIKKDKLHTSDLIRIILDIQGIKTVKSITISSDKSSKSESEKWSLALDPDSAPLLKDIDYLIHDIKFYKGQIPCTTDIQKIQDYLESLQQENKISPSTTPIKDIPIPVGKYRELSDYESIQNDFPANYGIGELGLPASASEKRKAQAKQLQAYLMFFDQILANYFAQLEHTKDLFYFPKDDQTYNQTDNKTTYFYQVLDSFPGAADILKTGSNSAEDKWNDIDLERRNRFLDHLMAQYCEKFTDYSLKLYNLILGGNSTLEEELINNKIAFLKNYPQISSGRGKAFNYTDSSWDTDDNDNVSGLKQRICSLLGIPYNRKTLTPSNNSDEIEGFHIVEHILLRPPSSNEPESDPNFLEFGHPISGFQGIQNNKTVTCKSNEHGLSPNDKIQIFNTVNYNGIYFVTNINDEQHTFEIEVETGFIQSESGRWIKVDHLLDPYSFQLSFVFPNWLTRFKKDNFKQLIYNIINAEVPAHITSYCHWFDRAEMKDFETHYQVWLNTIANQDATPNNNIKNIFNNLIKTLEIGTAKITEFNVIGYMIIGETFEVAKDPEVI
nr:hypothetical protein [Calothrix sp. MO_167.B42]